jgi:hypothetical protein
LTVDKRSAWKAVKIETERREAEASPLLEAVVKEQLMTQQAEKRPSGRCTDL